MKKIVWNQACHYWTGKKFKVCCGKKGQKTFVFRGKRFWYAALILSVLMIFIGIL